MVTIDLVLRSHSTLVALIQLKLQDLVIMVGVDFVVADVVEIEDVEGVIEADHVVVQVVVDMQLKQCFLLTANMLL